MALSLYIHIPFCTSKCVYCDFTSGYRPDEKTVREYCAALSRELGIFTENHPDKTSLSTLYIGGGTPSLLDGRDLETVFSAISGNYTGKITETTLEANPDDVTPEKASVWKKLGINRVSLGVQSMEERVLQALGRRNTPAQNRKAVSLLREAGFENISVDWIAGVRGENAEQNARDMLSLSPEHFSVYQLSVEEKTLLHQRVKKKEYRPLDDEETVAVYRRIAGVLREKGYERYEISNYSKGENFRSRHNLNYWDRGEYIGAGLGASGFIRENDSIGGTRWTNHTSFREYFASLERGDLPVGHREEPDAQTAYREYVMLGLRKTAGFRYSHFAACFGRDFHDIFDRSGLDRLSGFIVTGDAGIRLSDRGMEVMNTVVRKIWDTMKTS